MQEHKQLDIHNPYYGFWSTIALGALIFIAFSVIQSVLIILYILYQQNWNIEDFTATTLGLSGNAIAFAEIPSAILGILLILFVTSRQTLITNQQYLKTYFPSLLELLKWLGAMALVIIAMEVTNNVLEREVPEFMTQVFAGTDSKILLWIAVIIGAPFFEEYLFRGFIFEGLLHSKVGLIGAILITAFSWAIIHLQYGWFEIVTIFIIGIILGIAKYKTKSLYIPIAMHMLMNLTASIAMEQ